MIKALVWDFGEEFSLCKTAFGHASIIKYLGKWHYSFDGNKGRCESLLEAKKVINKLYADKVLSLLE